jgi:hypothetical protein
LPKHYNRGAIFQTRKTEKGFIESGVPVRSKQKSGEDIRGRSQKSEIRSEVFGLCGVVTVRLKVL